MSNGDTIELPQVDVSNPGRTSDGVAGPTGAVDGGSMAVTDYVPGGWNSSSGQYFDQITRAPYLQRAVVVVNGAEYAEWESVTVTMDREGSPPYSCRLTMSEQEPWPEAFAFIRIKPADKVDVFLDGYKAFSGLVWTRQVAYNATSHAVEIQAVAWSGLMDLGTVAHETGEFKNQDLMGIARQVAKPFGVNVTQVGDVPNDKFPRATVTPGETAWNFVEMLARQMNVFMTSNPNGDLVLMGGGQGGSDEIVEGRDILEGREHISLVDMPKDVATGGQAPGTDDEHGADTTHQRNHDGQQGAQDSGFSYMPHRILSEMPAFSMNQLKTRFGMEQSFNDSVKIEAQVTLLGWSKRSGGGLWIPGIDQVYLNAPMLILNRSLELKRAVYTQDNSTGTRVTLTLVNKKEGMAKE